MKIASSFIMAVIALTFLVPNSFAVKGRLATNDDIVLLKQDVLAGKIKVGKTRLKEIRAIYGEPQDIQDTDKKVIYNYGDLKIEFSKKYYLRDWRYDYSHKMAYSTAIKSLRKDLESGQVVGEWIDVNDKIIDSYDEPTEVYLTAEDGDYSVYYWAEVKLTFENYYTVMNLRGQKMGEGETVETLLLGSAPTKVVVPPVKEEKKEDVTDGVTTAVTIK